MVTYLTALGRLITKEENGTQIPVVVIGSEEYHLDADELMVWSSLHWNFLNQSDLEKEYLSRRNQARIYNDVSFEYLVQRLKVRKLIAECTDYLAADALYGLLSELRIRPVRFGIWDRIRSCCYLYFVKGVPVRVCIDGYFGTAITPNERKVLQLSKSTGVTAAEIIQCAEKNIQELSSEDDVMEELYIAPNETADTLMTASRFSRLKSDVLQAVANLYLKKKIIFE